MVRIGNNNYRNNIKLLKVRNSKDKIVMIQPIAIISLIILILVVGVITCGETGGG